MDYKDTKESKLQEAIKGIKQGCNDQFYKKDEEKIEGLVEEISFVRQVSKLLRKSEMGASRPDERRSQSRSGQRGVSDPVEASVDKGILDVRAVR